MKTKLEMAHEYAVAMLKTPAQLTGLSDRDIAVAAFNLAEAMQAEADKRENKTKPETLRVVQQTFINGVEQPRYATSMGDQKRTPKVSRFERSDAVKEVLNRAENMGLIKPKEPRETHKNLNEFKMYPEYDASINYPPDAWVMYKGEKRLAVSIDTEKEWQPDWSRAPDGYDWWAMDGFSGVANWYKSEPFLDEDDTDEWNVVLSIATYREAPSFGYTGDWRNSLRKRPQ